MRKALIVDCCLRGRESRTAKLLSAFVDALPADVEAEVLAAELSGENGLVSEGQAVQPETPVAEQPAEAQPETPVTEQPAEAQPETPLAEQPAEAPQPAQDGAEAKETPAEPAPEADSAHAVEAAQEAYDDD